MVDFMAVSDKEHSESGIGDMSIAAIVQQRQGKRKDSPLPPFHPSNGLQRLIKIPGVVFITYQKCS
jgi:hypothetical protein